MQAKNGADSVCFEEWPGKASSPQRLIWLLPGRHRDLKGLRICMSESGCMTVWVYGTSHGWSISKSVRANFEKSTIDLDGHEMSARSD